MGLARVGRPSGWSARRGFLRYGLVSGFDGRYGRPGSRPGLLVYVEARAGGAAPASAATRPPAPRSRTPAAPRAPRALAPHAAPSSNPPCRGAPCSSMPAAERVEAEDRERGACRDVRQPHQERHHASAVTTPSRSAQRPANLSAPWSSGVRTAVRTLCEEHHHGHRHGQQPDPAVEFGLQSPQVTGWSDESRSSSGSGDLASAPSPCRPTARTCRAGGRATPVPAPSSAAPAIRFVVVADHRVQMSVASSREDRHQQFTVTSADAAGPPGARRPGPAAGCAAMRVARYQQDADD